MENQCTYFIITQVCPCECDVIKFFFLGDHHIHMMPSRYCVTEPNTVSINGSFSSLSGGGAGEMPHWPHTLVAARSWWHCPQAVYRCLRRSCAHWCTYHGFNVGGWHVASWTSFPSTNRGLFVVSVFKFDSFHTTAWHEFFCF